LIEVDHRIVDAQHRPIKEFSNNIQMKITMMQRLLSSIRASKSVINSSQWRWLNKRSKWRRK